MTNKNREPRLTLVPVEPAPEKSGRNPDPDLKPQSSATAPEDAANLLRLMGDDDKAAALLPVLAEMPEEHLTELALALVSVISIKSKAEMALTFVAGLPDVVQLEVLSRAQFGQLSLITAWDRADNRTRAELILTRINPPSQAAPKVENKFHPSTIETSRHDVNQAHLDLGELLAGHMERIDRYGRVTEAEQITLEHRVSLILWQLMRGFREHVAQPMMISEIEMRRIRYQNATASERALWARCNVLRQNEEWKSAVAELERGPDKSFRLSANVQSQLGRLSRSGEGE